MRLINHAVTHTIFTSPTPRLYVFHRARTLLSSVFESETLSYMMPLTEHLMKSILFSVRVPVLSLNTYCTFVRCCCCCWLCRYIGHTTYQPRIGLESGEREMKNVTMPSSSLRFEVFTVMCSSLYIISSSHSMNRAWMTLTISKDTTRDNGIR